jgi:hypothetical protein
MTAGGAKRNACLPIATMLPRFLRCGVVAKALDFPAKFDDNLPII